MPTPYGGVHLGGSETSPTRYPGERWTLAPADCSVCPRLITYAGEVSGSVIIMRTGWTLCAKLSALAFAANAIHKTYHRSLVVHSTSDALFAHNVAYDGTGHMYVLENGLEQCIDQIVAARDAIDATRLTV